MTRPSPPSSRGRAHHRARAPYCPTCETNLWVGADTGRDGERRCHRCGWTTHIDDVDEGDGSRAHGPARDSPSDNPQGGCPTDSQTQGKSHDVGRSDRVIRDGSASYASGGESRE